MITIRLPKGKWKYDPGQPLGPEGGFGEVFLGESTDGRSVAVKRLKITASQAAHRELKIADLFCNKKFTRIMPYYDSGRDSESDLYFIIMPPAERSLEEKIQKEGTLADTEAAEILCEIAEGLIEVGVLVHRDLKPGNVLYYDSTWRIADFGIARFVEESTSLGTLKGCLSPPYAAPEQWKLERATHATDVYALGCIGYALLSGKPPFSGPSTEEYQDQHLHHKPPAISGCASSLQSLLLMMLRKVPDSRPSLDRVVKALETILKEHVEDSGKRFIALSDAGAFVVQQQAEEEAKEAKEKSERQQRQALAQQAKRIFVQVREELFTYILEAALAAIREDDNRIKLGQAVLDMRLIIGENIYYEPGWFPSSKWDVVLGGKIAVRQNTPRYIWSSSLWYCKLSPADSYRWREVSYFANPSLSKGSDYEPHSLEDPDKADQAAGPAYADYQVAFGPKYIDDEDILDFKNRWAELFAKAVKGQLRTPQNLPL